jgi:hypothetical protein
VPKYYQIMNMCKHNDRKLPQFVLVEDRGRALSAKLTQDNLRNGESAATRGPLGRIVGDVPSSRLHLFVVRWSPAIAAPLNCLVARSQDFLSYRAAFLSRDRAVGGEIHALSCKTSALPDRIFPKSRSKTKRLTGLRGITQER